MAKRSLKHNLTAAAVLLGRKGGKKGGPARDEALTSARKKDIARMGGKAKAKKGG